MSEKLELACDQCGQVAEAPVAGWIAIRPARQSKVLSIPPAKGDFCSRECLTTYVSKMAVQADLEAAMGAASAALDEPPPPPTARTSEDEGPF